MDHPALTLAELLAWSHELTTNWFRFLSEKKQLLALPCNIYGSSTVLDLIRHIVAVEVRHSQRLTGQPVSAPDQIPAELAALEKLHQETIARFRTLLADPDYDWSAQLEFQSLTAGILRASRRKLLAHTLLHNIRHWAQLATLTRNAGFPAPFGGDLLLSQVIE